MLGVATPQRRILRPQSAHKPGLMKVLQRGGDLRRPSDNGKRGAIELRPKEFGSPLADSRDELRKCSLEEDRAIE